MTRDNETEAAEAELPDGFFTVNLEVRNALREGRKEDAKVLVLDFLDKVAHPDFVRVVAEMLETKTRQPGALGRKPRLFPANWLEIGDEYSELKNAGIKYAEALSRLTDKYGRSARTVEKTLKFYNSMNDEMKGLLRFARK